MISITKDNSFALTNAHFSYAFRVTEEGLLEHVYFGAPLRNAGEIESRHIRAETGCTVNFRGIENLSLNKMPQEYPVYGRSDFRWPAFHGLNPEGNTVFSLIYKSHKITKDKPGLKNLPTARGGNSETLIVTLIDELQKLEVKLFYTVYENFGVLGRRATFENIGETDLQLQHVFSSSLDLPPDDYEILHLHGSWAREFTEERIDLPTGRFVVDSARGTSSAAHNPFIAIMQRGTTEDFGKVYASSLIYSGNYSLSVERGEFEDVRILAGINPFNFNWRLKPGKKFETPEALHVFSNSGLRGMSHIWHDFIREKISPKQFKNVARPTYLNTWEAAYFDVDEEKVLDLADKAKEIGVDMLVLDDGWFEGRCDDTSSLGDWRADKNRFPSGIPGIAAKVKAKGLKFGIWFEPEMVNPKSRLFNDHPDWTLHVPNREASLGRNQLTLDLSRNEVVEYLFRQIDDILSCGSIDYVKWDMNRCMTEVGSAGLSKNRQREVSHRYMLGLYKLLSRLTEKYPGVLFENCASGGNRFDLGMLSFMPQGWVSDMCDPVGRLSIINGASYIYPLDVMAAYIGPSPNHQNGRETSIQTRFLAGFFCAARGVSLNEADMDVHKDELTYFMAMAMKSANDIVGGRFDRILKNQNEVCWQYTNKGRDTVYLAYFHILSAPNLPFNQLRMVGLDKDCEYLLEEDGTRHASDKLMQHGLTMPYVTTAFQDDRFRTMEKGDFSSYLLVFTRS